MIDWSPMEDRFGFEGAITALAGFDAKSICDSWPRNLAKKSKFEQAQPRRNWRGVPPVFRFIASIGFSGPTVCWQWQGSVNAGGYGELYVVDRLVKATQLILSAEGKLRPSLAHGALHSCDNPICCNPAHLRWGTQAENSADMMARGRQGGIVLRERCDA